MLYENIPADLSSIPNWTRTSTPNGKAPIWGKAPEKTNTRQTLPALIPFLVAHPKHNAGIFTSINNSLIVVDLDDPKVCAQYLENPKAFTLLPSTYTEYSLSKKLHLYYSYPNKKWHYPAYVKHPAYTNLNEGQTSIYNNFMVVTGDHVPGTPLSLTELTESEFHNLTGLESTTPVETTTTTEATTPVETTTQEEITDLINALKVIPLNQSHKVKLAWTAITGRAYEHYDFWLSIGMALHSSASGRMQSRLAILFDEWSSTDPLAYTGTEDVLAKWTSFSSTPKDRYITKATIFALAGELRMQFPVMKVARGGRRVPDPEANDNYAYFLKYHNITIYTDYQNFYISGNDDILIKYFNEPFILPPLYGPFDGKRFKFLLTSMIQTQMFPGQHLSNGMATVMANMLMTAFTTTPNFFTMWLDSPHTLTQEYSPYKRPLLPVPPRKPPRSLPATLDTLLSFIDFAAEQDTEVARAIFYASFMLIIKLNCFPEIGMDSAEGFLYLTGPQSSYKSTFCESLVPLPLKRYFVRSLTSAIRSDKGLRDFQLALAAAPFLVIDETEGFINFDESSSQFKAIMSKGWLDVVQIYDKCATRLQRRAFVMGSSNDYEQRMMRNGTRKMWWVRIEHIHTEDVIYFDWHTFYNSMRRELEECLSRGEQPWILPKRIMKRLDESNMYGTAMNEVDLILRECFPIDTTVDARETIHSINNIQTSRLLCSAKQLQFLVKQRWPDFKASLPSLRNAAKRYAAELLNVGSSESFFLKGATGRYSDGQIVIGSGSSKKTYYIMPWTSDEVARGSYREWWTEN